MPPDFVNYVQPTWTFTADKVTVRPQLALSRPAPDAAAQKGRDPRGAGGILEDGFEGVYKLDSAKWPTW